MARVYIVASKHTLLAHTNAALHTLYSLNCLKTTCDMRVPGFRRVDLLLSLACCKNQHKLFFAQSYTAEILLKMMIKPINQIHTFLLPVKHTGTQSLFFHPSMYSSLFGAKTTGYASER